MRSADKLEGRFRRELRIQGARARNSDQIRVQAAVNAEESRDLVGKTIPDTLDCSPTLRVGVRLRTPLTRHER